MRCVHLIKGLVAGLSMSLSLVVGTAALGQSSANKAMSTPTQAGRAEADASNPRASNSNASNHPGTSRDDESSAPSTFGRMLESVRQEAIETILDSSRSERAEVRANALEAIQPLPKRALPLAQRAVNDQNPAVRFSALVTIGKLGLRSLGPAAARYLDDENASVRAAAIFAVHASGRQVKMNELPALLGASDPQTRGNVAMLLGMMGEPSAIKMLKDKAKEPMRRAGAVRKQLVDLQISEAIVKLGDESALEPIRAAAYSTEYEVKVMAVLMLGRLEDQRMAPALARMLHDQPVELELAAAQALAQTGDNRGLKTMLLAAHYDADNIAEQTRRFLEEHPTSPFAPEHRGLLNDRTARRGVAARGRSQSAFALSYVQSSRAARALRKLLEDPVARVRLSAAAAIVQALERD